MSTSEIHQQLVEQFGEDVIVAVNPEAIDPWIEVRADAVDQVAAYCKDELAFDQLSDLSAVDYFEPDPKAQKKFGHDPHLEVVYHCFSIQRKDRLNLKVKLERWKNGVEGELPEVPSVSGVWAIADWHEREAYDLMGIRFTGHPNLVRILCPDDWVGHALRKDYEFPLEYHGIRGK